MCPTQLGELDRPHPRGQGEPVQKHQRWTRSLFQQVQHPTVVHGQQTVTHRGRQHRGVAGRRRAAAKCRRSFEGQPDPGASGAYRSGDDPLRCGPRRPEFGHQPPASAGTGAQVRVRVAGRGRGRAVRDARCDAGVNGRPVALSDLCGSPPRRRWCRGGPPTPTPLCAPVPARRAGQPRPPPRPPPPVRSRR